MILGFKTKFPWGEPTRFMNKITKQEGYWPKIHTLRENFRFKPGMLIHFAINVRTKQYYEFYRDTCKNTQTVIICNIPGIGIPFIYVDGRRLDIKERELFALNDGFDNLMDFSRWFHKDIYVLQLTHWTNFKY
jgi:hypothetical protein